MGTSAPEHRRNAAFAVALLLTISAPLGHAQPPSNPPLEPDEGVVVLSVTGNTGQVNQVSSVWIRPIKTEERGRRKMQTLGNVAAGLARDTALFIGAVPAGEYAFEQLHSGESYITFGEGARQLLGTVRVEAGKVADIGRLIVTPLNTSVITGRSTIVTSNADLIRRFAPEHAGYLDLEAVPGWTSPRTPDDVVEEYALRRPVGADAPVELPAGEIVVASRLGTLLVRQTDGRWRSVRTGKLESLLWVTPVPGGELGSEEPWLIAVGELDTLVTVSGGGIVTPLDLGDMPHGNLLFIDGNETTGWYVAQQNGTTITIYHSASLDHGTWTPLRTESVAFSIWVGANNFWVWRTNGGFAYAVSDGRIHSLDYATGVWTDRVGPRNRLLSVVPHPDGSLGILSSPGAGFAGIFAEAYLSRAGSTEWVEITPPFKVKASAPRVLADGTLLVAGGGADQELQASTDGGVTWTLLSDDVGPIDNIVVLPSGALLALDGGAQFGLASIRHSSDNGATWVLEYSNFDRAAYQQQQAEENE